MRHLLLTPLETIDHHPQMLPGWIDSQWKDATRALHTHTRTHANVFEFSVLEIYLMCNCFTNITFDIWFAQCFTLIIQNDYLI